MTKPRTAMEGNSELHGKGRGYRSGEELGSFLQPPHPCSRDPQTWRLKDSLSG